MSKVCIIGLDGGTFRVIDYLMSQNRLPNFARIIGEGSRATLMSTIPTLTPAAWASFYTGTNPGKHGVVDFFHRDAGTYKLAPVNGGTVKAASIWSQASNLGKRVCVYNVPVTYPAEPVNGILISGMDAPRFDEQAVYPREFREEFLAAFPDFTIEPAVDAASLAISHQDPVGECISQFKAYLEQETGVIRYLMDLEEWDLFTAVIRSPDAFQHSFWRDVEQVIKGAHELGESENRNAESVFSCYEKIDDELGEVWSSWGRDRNLIIMSDHGFGLLQREVCINRVLADAGLFKFRQKSPQQRIKEVLFGQISKRIPAKMRKKISNKLHEEEGFVLIDRLVADVDWTKTRLYSQGQFGCLFINFKGREPLGIVANETERRFILEKARQALSSLTDPEDNQPVFTGFHLREDIYSGPFMAEMPDMVAVMSDGLFRGISNTRTELAQESIFRSPQPEWGVLAHSGNHRPEGILILHGPAIEHTDLGMAQMIDIAPTVMNLLGLPPLSVWDGKILESAFRGGAALPVDIGVEYEEKYAKTDEGAG